MRRRDWSAACLALGASAFVFLGSGSVWSFSERIGLAVGLSASSVTAAIGLTSLAGVVGALAALAAAQMKREFLWAALASTIFGCSVCALALAASPLSYVVALSVLSFAFMFTTPFLTAIAVRVDASGGLAGAVQGVQMLTGAVAPFLGGALLMTGSFNALAIVAAVASALAVVCVFGARRLAPALSIRS
jgi:predicted MFS family arabinose efflux permease